MAIHHRDKRTWGGQLGEHRINCGPGLGVEQTMDAAHPRR
jgi:hypothetical protein